MSKFIFSLRFKIIPNTEAAGIGRRLVEGARDLYADLNAQLQQTLAQLKRDYLTDEAKGLADALKAHREALQTLLDIELSFGKSASVNGGVKACHLGGAKVGHLVPRLGA